MKSVLFRNSNTIAIPFIDFWGLCLEDKKEYLDKLIPEYCPDVEGEADLMYYGLVNKEFKPELITELFEGWEKVENYNVYSFEGVEVDFVTDNILTTTHYRIFATHGYSLRMPRTLDDFINDCQRAGIELNWRIK